MAATDVLNRQQLHDALEVLPHWRYRLGGLQCVFKLSSARAALDLLARIGDLAEAAGHHPDVDWRYNLLFLRLTSHDAGSEVTSRDAALAKEISAAAEEVSATAKPELNRTVELGIDTADPSAVAETWRLALGYKDGPYGDLVDPYGRGPNVWFQKTETPNSSRMHVDVHVCATESPAVLSAVEGTGAGLDHTHAPQWVIVTDAQQNRLCMCTEEGRGPDL
ncbi:MAG: 4a-hydroxytetrahydrobiopterin dehydratase [Actinomycetota bacterium]|nr:4a-hydroxytetrahydrobiopterin dehydratase [Actinomycetota bacterium]